LAKQKLSNFQNIFLNYTILKTFVFPKVFEVNITHDGTYNNSITCSCDHGFNGSKSGQML